MCVGSAAADAGEVLQPLAAVTAEGLAGRPEKRPKVNPAAGLVLSLDMSSGR